MLRKFVHTNLPLTGFELGSLGPQAGMLPIEPPLLVKKSIFILILGSCKIPKSGREICEVRVWTENVSGSSDVIAFVDLSVLSHGLVVGFPTLSCKY